MITADERMFLHMSDEAYALGAGTATALYRFFDADDNLLYVGITASITRRIADHSRKPWCWKANRITLEWHPSIAAARAAEAAAIRAENPRHNIAGKPKTTAAHDNAR